MDFERVFSGVFQAIGMILGFLLFLIALGLGLLAVLAALMMWSTPDQLTALKSGIGSLQFLFFSAIAYKISNSIMKAASGSKE